MSISFLPQYEAGGVPEIPRLYISPCVLYRGRGHVENTIGKYGGFFWLGNFLFRSLLRCHGLRDSDGLYLFLFRIELNKVRWAWGMHVSSSSADYDILVNCKIEDHVAAGLK